MYDGVIAISYEVARENVPVRQNLDHGGGERRLITMSVYLYIRKINRVGYHNFSVARQRLTQNLRTNDGGS
jgi:hypothetical protein